MSALSLRILPTTLVWTTLLLAGLGPLGWLATATLTHWRAWGTLPGDVLAGTLLSDLFTATLATGMGIMVVWWTRGRVAGPMLLVPLAVPAMLFAHAAANWLTRLHLMPGIDTPLDRFRCAMSIALWAWPLPAALLVLALGRIDSGLLDAADLDGGRRRITVRLLLGPAVGALALTYLLCGEQTGVWDMLGAYRNVAAEIRERINLGAAGLPDTVSAHYAAAAVVGLCHAAMLAVICTIGVLGLRSIGPDPQALQARANRLHLLTFTWLTVLVAMLASSGPLWPQPLYAAQEWPRELGQTLLWAGVTAAVTFTLAVLACLRPMPLATALAIGLFIIGGPLLAVALLNAFNGILTGNLYEPVLTLCLFTARFGWLGLAASWVTWGRRARALRELAAADGATDWQTLRHVTLPTAWPMLAGASLAAGVLSMAESQASLILRPPTIMPILLTWVHTLNYAPMIDVTLLLVILLLTLALIAAWLMRRGLHAAAALLLCLTLLGCDDVPQPDQIIGHTGGATGQFVYPRAIAVNAQDGTFFITDRSGRVQRFNVDGTFATQWSLPRVDRGFPVGQTVGPDGNLWIADTHEQRVMVYTPDGELVRKFGEWGYGPGQFIYPTDIAFDGTGQIFISEYGEGGDRIQVFTADGQPLRAFGSFGDGEGQFRRPQAMVIDGNTLYVTDAANHRIAVFTLDGTYIRSFGKLGDGPGEFRFPYGLEMEAGGTLLVTEFGNNRIQQIDPATGKGLGTWGMAGTQPGQLKYPWSAAPMPDGRTMVVDSGNNRLQLVDF